VNVAGYIFTRYYHGYCLETLNNMRQLIITYSQIDNTVLILTLGSRLFDIYLCIMILLFVDKYLRLGRKKLIKE
jgi:hypothetical protein